MFEKLVLYMYDYLYNVPNYATSRHFLAYNEALGGNKKQTNNDNKKV